MLVCSGIAPSAAAQVVVLTTGAYHDAAERAIAASGVSATVATDTAGAGLRRVRAGEPFDVVVNTQAGIDALIAEGILAPPRRDIARVGIGVAVRAGSPHPDLSDEGALRQLLLAAPQIAMIDPAAGGSSGVALFKLFERWGVMEALRPKLVLVQGGQAAERVAAGEAAVALQQMTELNVSGVDVVGPLPEGIQVYTVYAAAVRIGATDKAQSIFDAMSMDTAAPK